MAGESKPSPEATRRIPSMISSGGVAFSMNPLAPARRESKRY